MASLAKPAARTGRSARPRTSPVFGPQPVSVRQPPFVPQQAAEPVFVSQPVLEPVLAGQPALAPPPVLDPPLLDPPPARRRPGPRPQGPGPRPARPGRRTAQRWSRFAAGRWPLPIVLCLQAALSLRLVRVNTAFEDEALYLWTGHLEWSHWLHGTSVPNSAAYFSGAPVLYPPLGALADSIGGLAAARLLSLCFMLTASVLLWSTTKRLYGTRAAFFGTALWAVLGPTLRLGAFATYDAMSLCLIALAVWCAVHAGPERDETRWIAATAAALVLANATKYASALFDPVVVAIVIAQARILGTTAKQAISRGAALAAYVTAGVILLVMIGGGLYEAGIGQTTLTRAMGTSPPLAVLEKAWTWTAPVVVIALAGVLAGLLAERSWHRRMLLAVLAAAAALAPIQQARIHTLTSLDKHADFGAWFAAIAAGYAAERLTAWPRWRWLRVAATLACACALIVPAQAGAAQSRVLFGWPNATRFDKVFGSLAIAYPGRFLVETPSVPEYYLPEGRQWKIWSSTRSIVLPSGRSISARVSLSGNPRVYARYVRRGYFHLVALDFIATPSLDHKIATDLNNDKAYRVVAHVPYGPSDYTIWARIPRVPPERLDPQRPEPQWRQLRRQQRWREQAAQRRTAGPGAGVPERTEPQRTEPQRREPHRTPAPRREQDRMDPQRPEGPWQGLRAWEPRRTGPQRAEP